MNAGVIAYNTRRRSDGFLFLHHLVQQASLAAALQGCAMIPTSQNVGLSPPRHTSLQSPLPFGLIPQTKQSTNLPHNGLPRLPQGCSRRCCPRARVSPRGRARAGHLSVSSTGRIRSHERLEGRKKRLGRGKKSGLNCRHDDADRDPSIHPPRPKPRPKPQQRGPLQQERHHRFPLDPVGRLFPPRR